MRATATNGVPCDIAKLHFSRMAIRRARHYRYVAGGQHDAWALLGAGMQRRAARDYDIESNQFLIGSQERDLDNRLAELSERQRVTVRPR